ncbi:MAG: SNF2 helicase associated domain-containing protein [Oscillospiraceae bacterium]|nr:SNF2 helicase associated domain-containing protein [Oscillospiraceae bacterium]
MKISDGMIKKICSSMIYKRGAEYFLEGRVHMRRRTENELTAVVDGEELYNVQITFDDDKINKVLCSCPYYETMQTTCKHIVAVLKQRQAELEQGGEYTNENDKLASALCREFAVSQERRRIRAAFTLFVKPKIRSEAMYEMSISLPECSGRIQGLENFLDSYLSYRDFKIDRNTVYNRKTMYFPENEDKIISILAEVYETRSTGIQMYTKAVYRTAFGAAVLRRILPYLSNVDFSLVYDGITLSGVRIINDDPDILIDIAAYDKEIVLSLSEAGISLTADGEWFLYSDNIYRTSSEWREYFMPVYRVLERENRMQVTFKGDNTMLFAANVLPKLRGRCGVVINGVEDIIVNSKPCFDICLDADGNRITAVVVAKYGSLKFRIPREKYEENGKIVIRDTDLENRILSFFNGFDREKSVFSLGGDSAIYNFITNDLPELAGMAELIMTDRFKAVRVRDDINMSMGISYKNDIDFLEINFETDLAPEEIKGIMAAMRLKHSFYRTSDGSFIGLNHNKKGDILRLLERLDLTNVDIYSGRKTLPKFHMLYLEARNDIEKDESVKRYMREIRSIEPVISDGLENVLRPYQIEGMRWLTQLSEMGMGGILADDMGLGKTLQVIAFVRGIKPEKPIFIVAPSTLIYNWQREIEKFTPEAKSLIISGSKEMRTELIKTVDDYEFIITSYPLLRRDSALYRNIEFSYCFIDEAQYIKNPKTMNAISVKRIRAEHKFALTGTPIENSLMELWSIFDFVMPGYLKSAREFRDRFEVPASRNGDSSISDILHGIIRPFVLRRMKKDVLDELPEKIETTMLADLSRTQQAMYLEFLSEIKEQARGIIAENGNRFMILTLLMRLRQICCHPALFTGSADTSDESGKLELLIEIVKNGIGSGHRILVFSQFRSMLDIIEKQLNKDGIDHYYINGSTPAEERSAMAESFNNGRRTVFLVSLKAGGTGLNLVGADMVIHYDPWWNPAVTDQATDRAYRIGQTRSVQVIKLAARGTIEEKIIELQEKKRLLADDIIRVNTETFASLTDEEVMSLFEF